MLDKNLLKGKKTIITGASYGIGKSLAIGFADLGSEVGRAAGSVLPDRAAARVGGSP